MKDIKELLENCLYFSSGQLFREINTLAEINFAPLGLTPSYAFLLMIIHDKKEVATGDAAKIIGLNASTITRLADKLISRKLINRRQEGRNIYLTTTNELTAFIPKVYACWEQLGVDYTIVLGEASVNDLKLKINLANKKF
ncbi:DNA-binding transcriptional regulator, MarR family [Chryseobacterium soldanellicola]|uniref:DNA-binding transcriptional regulator, MarR family n=1 Tax=Chryseobacterium soldanellicola TaxID=311333 RepID=A0A1H1FBF4_9FLAO|nr:MarR family transcriptional regulator [Chryseobacterium soldanellicola]SDQ98247.1 DNA-binding transcriptional regulator, MarR family [Chryseobacterium soldanellicola]